MLRQGCYSMYSIPPGGKGRRQCNHVVPVPNREQWVLYRTSGEGTNKAYCCTGTTIVQR